MAKGIPTASSSSKIDDVINKWFGKKNKDNSNDKTSNTTGQSEVGGGGTYNIRMIPFYLSKKHNSIVVGIRHQKPGVSVDVWNFKPDYVSKALSIYKTEFLSKNKDVFKEK